jgi:hypothetical protein
MADRDETDLSGLDFDDYDLGDDESTVHHVDSVDLRSLGVVAGLFYLTAFLVLALAVVAVWLFAASLGLISQVEDFMRSIGFRGFRLVGPEVILGFVLILGALVVFLTVMTLVAAAFYNLLGTGRRGVRIRTSVVHPQPARAEQEAEPARPVVIEPAAAPHEDGDEDGDEGEDEGEGEAKPAAAAG